MSIFSQSPMNYPSFFLEDNDLNLYPELNQFDDLS